MATGLVSGTSSIPGAATQVQVTGVFATSYQVTLTPTWITECAVSSKTTSSFVVTFSVPSPQAGGGLDWLVAFNLQLLPFGTSPATADVTIASDALVMLGEQAIASFDDDSDAARAMKRLYPQARDAVLRAHPWNFAMVRTTLTALTTKPAMAGEENFAYYFQLPTDPYCLRVFETDGDEDESPWRVEGRRIISADSTISIVYVSRVTDPTLFDSLFVAALRARLAAESAYAITSQRTLQDAMWTLYAAALKEARTVDGQEQGIRRIRTRTLTSVR